MTSQMLPWHASYLRYQLHLVTAGDVENCGIGIALALARLEIDRTSGDATD